MPAPKRIPKKLKNDAIVEAVLEIRFDLIKLPEVFFGRLVDYAPWAGFEQNRMPAYDIPAAIRQGDAALRIQPLFELRDAAGKRLVRIGPQVISYHRISPYVGWAAFKAELDEAVTALFLKAEKPLVRRLGLRYINAIDPELHEGIDSIARLDLKMSVADEDITDRVNINFLHELSDDTEVAVRVGTKDFATGAVPRNASIIIDVDVHTKPSYKTNDPEKVRTWVEFAHTNEKMQFFRLLTHKSIDAMSEE